MEAGPSVVRGSARGRPLASPDDVRWPADGLVPAIAQDAGDGTVLMLAWVDREAVAATLATGLAHFHSRSRGRLWRKGETSGNELRVHALALDCDRDAVLMTVDAAGPACHTGARSCFEGEPGAAGERETGPRSGAGRAAAGGDRDPARLGWLEVLWETIASRVAAGDPTTSYTARLVAGGVDAAARKVTEEATEVLLAARDDAEAERGREPPARRVATRAALAGETADLLYHVLVLCAERGLDPAEVVSVLQSRHRP